MKIEEFLGRLQGVEKTSGGWIACCPAHDDKSPSLSVAIGRNGGIVINCHAGCSAETIVAAMGLKLSDLMPERSVEPEDKKTATIPSAPGALKQIAKRGGKKLGRHIADYLYKDTDGVVRFKVVRYDPKDFRQYSPDPNDPTKWVFGVSSRGVKYIPFHLPEVTAAAASGKVIFIAEGEKDVEALAKIGVTASCNAGGAGKGWLAEYCDYFKGVKRIYVIADNDGGPESGKKEYWQGQRHATNVRNAFRAAGFEAEALVLPQNAQDGRHVKDAFDWIASGGTKAQLADLLKHLPAWPKDWEALAGTAAAVPDGNETSSSCSAPEKDSAGAQPPLPRNVFFGSAVDSGRPLSPGELKKFAVDYNIGAGKKITITMDGAEALRDQVQKVTFSAWQKSEGKFPAREMKDLAAVAVLLWLRSRGKFFWNSETREFISSMFFDSLSGTLLKIRSDQFQSWIAIESGINRSTAQFEYLMSLVDDAAMSPECSVGVVPSVLWDRRGDVLYISNGDSSLARISANKVEILPNGTDNVVFLVGKTLKEWNLLGGPGDDPFQKTKLFEGASFRSQHGRMLTRLWVLGLFACFHSRPALVFTGRWQSGKSRTAKGISEILGSGNRLASVKENGETDFWVSLDGGGLITFDNVDSRNKWFGDAMQAAATDGSTEVRKMYSHEMKQLRANASIILTSNNPLFATESGLSDRLLIVRLDTSRKRSSDKGLTVDIEAKRDAAMTWISRTLAKVMADSEPVPENINMRHPDFGEFAVRCGRAIGAGEEALAALKSAEIDKALFPLQNDRIGKLIMQVISSRGGNWEGSSGELSDLVIESLDRPDEDTKKRLGSRYVGNCLSKFKDQFATVFVMAEPRVSQGKTHYEFTGIQSSVVGLVGCKADFDSSGENGIFGYKGPNGPSNPPNPPLKNVEEKKEEESNKEFGYSGEEFDL